MRARFVPLGIFALTAIGCMSQKPKDEPFVPADAYTVATIRDTLQKSDPSARVGQVVDVDPQYLYAAVADIPIADFKEGDVITFIDSSQKPIDTGKVIRILTTSSQLHVKYDPPAAGGRAPMVGDLAVRVN